MLITGECRQLKNRLILSKVLKTILKEFISRLDTAEEMSELEVRTIEII